MAYTDIDKSTDYFNTVLYTGNASAGHAITGVGFQPDWVWIKRRGTTGGNMLTDSIRGVTKTIITNETGAEQTFANGLTAFGTDGFTVGSEGGFNSSHTIVSWNWKAGTSFTNDASSTGIGSIDSEGSVNQTAGFSICKFVGTGANATVKHGLNSAPQFIIFKDTTNTKDWFVYHQDISPANGLKLNSTGNPSADSGYFNDTAPTTSVFSVGNGNTTNASSATMISYCFSPKQGFSKFGSYVGNGNVDGTFVNVGFTPAFVLLKNQQQTEQWWIFDNKRNGTTGNFRYFSLNPNSSSAEGTTSGDNNHIDFYSNGFKLRTTAQQLNGDDNFVYAAFAEAPFVTSSGAPAVGK